jgi:hypothetical protein
MTLEWNFLFCFSRQIETDDNNSHPFQRKEIQQREKKQNKLFNIENPDHNANGA